MTPDWAGPAGVAFVAGDNMDVKLPDDIAQRADIDLGGPGNVLQRGRDEIGLERQHGLIERSKIEQLAGAASLWHQHQPGPAAVVLQTQLA
ncbi:hypothetical protein D3C80_1943720 [compost metagenome]